jgi:hypothetical protein
VSDVERGLWAAAMFDYYDDASWAELEDLCREVHGEKSADLIPGFRLRLIQLQAVAADIQKHAKNLTGASSPP